MTRVARGSIFSGAKHFHVLTDGLPGLDVFREPNMKNFYLVTVEEKAKDTGVSVLAYCVMQNHSHLIVTSDDVQNISEFMRRVNTTYAKFFNRINGRSGYVFNGRYESDALKTSDEILAAINFVHNNPESARCRQQRGISVQQRERLSQPTEFHRLQGIEKAFQKGAGTFLVRRQYRRI